MTTSGRWIREIDDACAERDPVRSNRLITGLHYRLSEALLEAMGHAGGPNFHSWAVWGSRKAGVTIRQEDLEDAVDNARKVAGFVGGIAGTATGILARRWIGRMSKSTAGTVGAGLGAFTGAWTGTQIALWSRAKAARLILEGNRTVIRDIGTQSARFLELLESGATSEGRARFFAGMRPGPTEGQGQDRLAKAFAFYLDAVDSVDIESKRSATIAGNCEIVYHEHIRLEPYIRGSMPFLVRRCVTQRWMSYEVGDRVLTVGTNLPGVPTPTAASNWAQIEDRMRYIFALFRNFHTMPAVLSAPFAEMESNAVTSRTCIDSIGD